MSCKMDVSIVSDNMIVKINGNPLHHFLLFTEVVSFITLCHYQIEWRRIAPPPRRYLHACLRPTPLITMASLKGSSQ